MAKAIQVENVSKQYRLGQIGTGSMADDLNRWWHSIRGKEDPYLKIGETNDRTKKGTSEYVWSLRDVSFDIEQGDSVGIIGRNGAGKSTLLKILSRVTAPTTGNVKVKGRVASLLEVGTGFHPDLSGRDNIYLNGAILGMRKAEIRKKFDEIVDFAGVERYIDTPVKRYSSGMYVRLAFAVAAHLESEILIVDEVLAVGDAEFQKKCLGKMGDVSTKEGRTILFVSHNMTAITSLCSQAIFLANGVVDRLGETGDLVSHYLSSGSETFTYKNWDINKAPGDGSVNLLEARLVNKEGQLINSLDFYQGGSIEFTYNILDDGYRPVPNMFLHNQQGDHVFASIGGPNSIFTKRGVYKTSMAIPGELLNEGRYTATLATTTMIPEQIHFSVKNALVFDVIENMEQRDNDYRMAIPGIIRPKLNWSTNQLA